MSLEQNPLVSETLRGRRHAPYGAPGNLLLVLMALADGRIPREVTDRTTHEAGVPIGTNYPTRRTMMELGLVTDTGALAPVLVAALDQRDPRVLAEHLRAFYEPVLSKGVDIIEDDISALAAAFEGFEPRKQNRKMGLLFRRLLVWADGGKWAMPDDLATRKPKLQMPPTRRRKVATLELEHPRELAAEFSNRPATQLDEVSAADSWDSGIQLLVRSLPHPDEAAEKEIESWLVALDAQVRWIFRRCLGDG